MGHLRYPDVEDGMCDGRIMCVYIYVYIYIGIYIKGLRMGYGSNNTMPILDSLPIVECFF